MVIWWLDEQNTQERLLFAEGELRSMRSSAGPGVTIEQALSGMVDRDAGRYAFYKENLVGDAVSVSSTLEYGPLLATLVRASTRTDGVARVLEARKNQLLRIRRGHSRQSLGLTREEGEVFDVMRAAPVSPEALASRSGRPEVAQRLLYLLELIDALEVHTVTGQGAGQEEQEGEALGKGSSEPRRTHRVSSTSMPAVASHGSSQTLRAPGPEPSQARLRLDATAPADPPPSVSEPPRASKMRADETPSRRRSSDGLLATPKEFPSPPAKLSEDERQRWLELEAKYAEEDRANHFEFLGVSEEASVREIESAFVRMAKLCHPDRLTPPMQVLRPFADHLFRRATTAREVLLKSPERAEYIKTVKRGAGTPEAERREREIVTAALDFAKVDALLRRKSFAEAHEIIDRNLELSPDIADYPAKKAQALILEFGMDQTARRAEIGALLDRALELDESHESANFLKGQLLKRMGDQRGALAHFQACLESNPHHIDAARELRLARMRKTTPAEGTGLFGRLFKKK